MSAVGYNFIASACAAIFAKSGGKAPAKCGQALLTWVNAVYTLGGVLSLGWSVNLRDNGFRAPTTICGNQGGIIAVHLPAALYKNYGFKFNKENPVFSIPYLSSAIVCPRMSYVATLVGTEGVCAKWTS